MDCSPQGSPIHGILQARILEWVAIAVSRETSWPKDWTHVSRFAGGFFIIWATWEVPLQWEWSTMSVVIFKLIIKFLKKLRKEVEREKKWTQFTCRLAIRMDIRGCIGPRWLSSKESACWEREAGSSPGLGRSPREGNGNPLQYSCLRNPTDRGAWRATVRGVAKELDMA